MYKFFLFFLFSFTMPIFEDKTLKVKVKVSRSVLSDSLRHHELYSPWNSPGQNTGVGSHSLLQRIFPTLI